MHALIEECVHNVRIFFFRMPKFFLFVKNDLKVEKNYVLTSKFDRGRGSKSDVTDTFMSE